MRRTLTIAATAAVAATLAMGTTACGALDKALDCANTAVTIADSVGQLEKAVSGATENPEQARESLNTIDKNLDELGEKTDNADLQKAVDDMSKAVENARTSLEDGRTPDVSPVGDAADEISSVCTPG